MKFIIIPGIGVHTITHRRGCQSRSTIQITERRGNLKLTDNFLFGYGIGHEEHIEDIAAPIRLKTSMIRPVNFKLL